MLVNNVLAFPNNNKLYDDIIVFLKENKELTRKVYESNIKEFFKIMKNKDIEHLKEEDLIFKRNDILKYRQYLQDSGIYQNNTINTKIFSIRSLYNNLEANEYNVNSNIFKIKALPEHTNSYGNLSLDESIKMAKEVYKTETIKQHTKHYLILFAVMTSFRIDECLKAKWSDFRKIEKGYSIKIIGKRDKERETSISDRLFNAMQIIKEENNKYKFNKNEDLIFQISKDAINDMMKRLRKKLDIPKERNIVFHSFRNVAINWILDNTSDVIRAFEHSGHASLDTFYNHYVKKGKDLNQTPGILMDEEIDWSFLDDYTKEELIELIKEQGYELYFKLKNAKN